MKQPLKPFAPFGGAIGLAGSFERDGDTLRIQFDLHDPRREVVGGPVAGGRAGAEVVRADDLWKVTCFEAFWGEVGSASYWELNLAPSGLEWNLYRFDGYRMPQPPTKSEDFTLERVSATASSFECELRARRQLGPLQASLCAVVRTAQGPVYFSVRHAGEKADFHLRQSFCLEAG